MIRNAQDIIDDMRNIVKPRIAKMLLEANFEGCGEEDKAEFETEFEMTLTLAEKALEQEPILDKIKKVIAKWKADNFTDGFAWDCMQDIADIIDKAESEAKMGMKLYDFTLKALNLAIPEFKKEGYSEKDIQEGFDLAKRILNRLVLKKDAKDALNKAIDDAKDGKTK